MNANSETPMAPVDDARLVAQALNGNREAFGEIVRRYQNLVCSLAYSACGNFARSEDLAQETFLAAWRSLGSLREPDRVKSWLCGIARKLIANSVRRESRSATHNAVSWDETRETADNLPSPWETAADRDEETIVWQSLEQIPENYREPLVLFYREQQSVANVASALELSEDAVKQRLSRGRQMLRQQVAKLVESTLGKSRPGASFTVAVLAALPALAPSAATAAVAATAAKGSSTAKAAAMAGGGAAVAGPVLGLLGGWLGVRLSIKNTRSPRERRFVNRMAWWIMGLVVLFIGGMLALTLGGRELARGHTALFAGLLAGFILAYVAALLALIVWGNRRQKQIQIEDGTYVEPAQFIYDSSGRLNKANLYGSYGGATIGAVCGLISLPWQVGDWLSVGIILAAGLIAFVLGTRATRRRPERSRRHSIVTFGSLGVCWLVLINLQLAHWFPQHADYPEALRWLRLGLNALIVLVWGFVLLCWRLTWWKHTGKPGTPVN